jgi:hypothetical protein
MKRNIISAYFSHLSLGETAKQRTLFIYHINLLLASAVCLVSRFSSSFPCLFASIILHIKAVIRTVSPLISEGNATELPSGE